MLVCTENTSLMNEIEKYFPFCKISNLVTKLDRFLSINFRSFYLQLPAGLKGLYKDNIGILIQRQPMEPPPTLASANIVYIND